MLCLVAQSCPTLCNPMDCSPPGSSVFGIFEARILSSLFISAQISERLKYLKVKVSGNRLYPTLCDSMDCSLPDSSIHGMDLPGKNTGVGCHFLLQGIFLTQGLNLCLWVSCIAGGFFTAEPQTYFISLFPSVRMQFLKGQGLGLFHLLLYSSCLDCSSINNLLSE